MIDDHWPAVIDHGSSVIDRRSCLLAPAARQQTLESSGKRNFFQEIFVQQMVDFPRFADSIPS
jgi:hypothetical protein